MLMSFFSCYSQTGFVDINVRGITALHSNMRILIQTGICTKKIPTLYFLSLSLLFQKFQSSNQEGKVKLYSVGCKLHTVKSKQHQKKKTPEYDIHWPQMIEQLEINS